MAFNEAQKAAIAHGKGPAMVLAGPGSGKTTVITHRILHLIRECKVNPTNILVITFTRMAAKEMKDRFLKLSNYEYGTVTFGTFHAIFFAILKHAYHYRADNIIRTQEQMDFLKNQIRLYELEVTDENEYAGQILSEISRVKNERFRLDEYEPVNCSKQIFSKIYDRYEKMLHQRRMIDFDDMMVYCYELFTQRPDILAAWQNQYQYILTDEFQDICRAQYDVVRLLTEPRRNLFIVGDDDQSIYGFRGAKPDIMREFERDYKEAAMIHLNTNYRSDAHIVMDAGAVITHNQNRFKKDITTVNGAGAMVQVHEFETVEDENTFILQQINQISAEQPQGTTMAVLTRTNAGAGPTIQKFVELNLPFEAREPVNNIFHHWIAEDLFAYLSLAEGCRERNVFLKVMNKPVRYLSRDALPVPVVSFEQIREFYQDKDWMQTRINDLIFDLNMIQKLSPFAAVNYIRRAVGYEDYLKMYAKEHRIKEQDLLDRLDEIQESGRGYASYTEWKEYIKEYSKRLEETAKSHKEDPNHKNREAVHIVTMHACKGLEYDVVFLVDVNEGMTPYHKAVLNPEIEEERRMFYVAMTRAKKQLYLCFVRQRYNKKMHRSRFIEELDPNHTEYHLLEKEEHR